MKKTLFILATTLLISLFSYGQKTIEIAKGYTSMLIFEDPIKDVKNGNPLEFKAKKGGETSIELNINPKAFPKKGTNIIVFTADGSIYQLDLVVKTVVTNNIHPIARAEATVKGTLKVKKQKSKAIKNDNSLASVTYSEPNLNVSEEGEFDPVIEKIKKACAGQTKRSKRIVGKLEKKYKMIFSLRDVAYLDDHIYLFFDLKNKGGQAYDVEWIRYYKSTNDMEGYSTNQRNTIPTTYIHNDPKRVEGKSRHTFIAVIAKTSISENKAITVRVKELGGERILGINIKDQIINNPVKL
ncbi:DUF4138 domain-containing protein [Tenacibaculum agarivorans]|uniref:DUF4138 domain-containing protein n=1 Tax=Tenacibaculum agarivorans TaxID=1908389 RepID=UPI0009F8878C|nr:DUF4138 domain-containing protein [Tenacibaculum agarivorans]